MGKFMRVVVLGAGISGLSAAWFLKQRFKDDIVLSILEKTNRVGGWIETIRKGGFLFETGPHSLRYHGGEATLQLIEQLGLQQEVLPAEPNSRKRYLYYGGRLRKLPHSLLTLLSSPFVYQFLRAALSDLWRLKGGQEDESIESFARRRFGGFVTETFIDPLISGIYAGDISQLSVKSCFPNWHTSEKDYGSVLRGAFSRKSEKNELSEWMKPLKKAGIYTFREGLGSLGKALWKGLEKEVHVGVVAERVHFEQEGVRVTLTDGRVVEGDYLLSALPPRSCFNLLVKSYPELVCPVDLSAVSVVAISLGYRKRVLCQEGFGYLIPSREGEKVLGVIWDSSVFPEQNSTEEETRLTLMLGGAHHPELVGLSDQELLEIALESLRVHLGITAEPDAVHINRACEAIPQYHVGYDKQIEALKRDLLEISQQRCFLLGTGFGGVSINDCIANSRSVSENLILGRP